MKRIYIAGKLRTPLFINYVENCRVMCEVAREVQKAGFAIYVPCWDLLQVMLLPGITFDNLFDNSVEWLEVCDAMLVVGDNWRTSQGTLNEIRRAEKQGIPVFYNLDDLMKHFLRKR